MLPSVAPVLALTTVDGLSLLLIALVAASTITIFLGSLRELRRTTKQNQALRSGSAQRLAALTQSVRLGFRRCAGASADLTYDQGRGQWVASVPLSEEDGPTVAFALDGVPADRPDSALLAAIALLVDDAPPVVSSNEERPQGVAVRQLGAGRNWQIYQPCEDCGGGWLSTQLMSDDCAGLARLLAKRRVADHITESSCPHCLAQHLREHDTIDSITPCAWYDTVTSEWMLWTPLDEDTGVSMPLGIQDYFARAEMIAAAAARQTNS